jgi:hypothetical protein
MQTLKGQYQTLKADALVDWQPTQGFEMVGNRIKPLMTGLDTFNE